MAEVKKELVQEPTPPATPFHPASPKITTEADPEPIPQPSPQPNTHPTPDPDQDPDSSDDQEDLTHDYPTFALPTNALLPDPVTLPPETHDAPPPPPPQPSSPARTNTSSTTTTALPRRGLKDFEPHNTSLQASALAASRAAMHAALSHTRTHAARTRVLGVYDERVGTVRVRKRKGAMFGTVGRDLGKEDGVGWSGGVEMVAEEALWGLESGRVDVRWRGGAYCEEQRGNSDSAGGKSVEGEDEADDEEGLLPMSLQGAYAAFLGDEGQRTNGHGLTMEKYVVYASLKRAGFIVTRAEGFHGGKELSKKEVAAHHTQAIQQPTTRTESGNLGVFTKLYRILARPYQVTEPEQQRREAERLASGPLVTPGLYRSYADIYRLLSLIPAQAPPHTNPTRSHLQPATPPSSHLFQTQPTSQKPHHYNNDHDEEREHDENQKDEVETTYTTTYNIYSPNTHYRKSAPPAPHYRICVISARTTRLPTLPELHGLLAEQPAHTSPLSSITTPYTTTPTAGRDAANASAPNDTASTPPTDITKDRKTRTLGATYAALKRGQSSVLLAVVDEGIVSYLRVSEAGFVVEGRLFEREEGGAGSRGGKGGGRRGRGGRGRGGRAGGGGGRGG